MSKITKIENHDKPIDGAYTNVECPHCYRVWTIYLVYVTNNDEWLTYNCRFCDHTFKARRLIVHYSEVMK